VALGPIPAGDEAAAREWADAAFGEAAPREDAAARRAS